jgi:hypothetical protein
VSRSWALGAVGYGCVGVDHFQSLGIYLCHTANMLEVQTQEQTMGYKEAKKVKVNLVGEI